jgi:hypothetical protein
MPLHNHSLFLKLCRWLLINPLSARIAFRIEYLEGTSLSLRVVQSLGAGQKELIGLLLNKEILSKNNKPYKLN